METLVIRLVLLVILFLLLTGDYHALFSHLLQDHPTGGKRSTAREQHDHDSDTENVEDALERFSPSNSARAEAKLLSTIKNSCLPKLICELNATPHKERLTESEKSLLSLIRDTSISVTAEVTSKYHFAAHMGQLIAGVDGNGCHNFYPMCPFPALKVLNMIKKVRIR